MGELLVFKTKTCKQCNSVLPEDCFYFTRAPYRASYCKPCCNKRSRDYELANSEIVKRKKREAFRRLTPEQKLLRQIKKRRVEMTCIDCGVKWIKRKDSPSLGRCGSCCRKEVASRPEIKEANHRNGLEFVRRFGKLPAPKMENRRRGKTHWKWMGGVTPYRIKLWQSPEYKAWRIAVFTRDNFECVACGTNTHALQADHIKPFALFPDLRFEVSNGRTMCVPCHRKYGAKVSCGKLIREASFDYRQESPAMLNLNP